MWQIGVYRTKRLSEREFKKYEQNDYKYER